MNINNNVDPSSRFVLGMASKTHGNNPVGENEHKQALNAQSHYLAKIIYSTFNVACDCIADAGIGLGIGLYQAGNYTEVSGTKEEVMRPCGANTGTLLGPLTRKFAEYTAPKASWSDVLTPTYWGLKGVQSNSDLSIGSEYLNQVNEGEKEGYCRIVNRFANSLKPFDDSPTLRTAFVTSAVVLSMITVYRTFSVINASEVKAEADLKASLTDRYAKIAKFIQDNGSDEEVQVDAQKILDRCEDIRRELKELNLTELDVQKITDPVFDAARAICDENN